MEPPYTTQEEVLFVHRLANRCTSAGSSWLLRRYLEVARMRCWTGCGMNVDPGLVILEAEDTLDRLEQQLHTGHVA